jgi:hypothetical protein
MKEESAFERFYNAEVNPPLQRVALAYCHGETVRPAFMRSVIHAIVEDKGRLIHGYITSEGLYVPRGRNEIVGEFLLKSGCEWLWFLDTDVEFRANTLKLLMDATEDGEKKIVAAPYWNVDGETGSPYCTWMDVVDGSLLPYAEIPEEETIELMACGMGCTLIHRDVFVDVARNYKEDPWMWFSHDLITTEHGNLRLGEDVSFCLRAAVAGHTTWGVTGVEIDHLKLRATPRGKVVEHETAQA